MNKSTFTIFSLALLGLGALALAVAPDPHPTVSLAEPQAPVGPGAATPTQSSTGARRRAAVVDPGGSYGVPAGGRLSYAVDVRTRATATGNGPVITGILRGRLQLLIVEQAEDALLVQVTGRGLALSQSIDGRSVGRDQTLEGDLARPAWLRLACDGRILGIGFAPETASTSRPWLVTLLAALQFTAGGGNAWECEERDMTGSARVRYDRRDDGAVVRTKVEYLGEAAPQVVASHGVAMFDVATGWIADARYAETLMHEVPGTRLAMRVGFDLRACLVAVDRVAVSALPRLPATLIDPREAGRDPQAARAALADWRREIVAGKTTPELLAALAHRGAGDRTSEEGHDPLAVLAWAIADRPQIVAEVGAALDAGGLDERTAALALSALGAAGVASAQALLTDLAQDAGRATGLRHGAVRSLFQVEAPTSAALDAIRALARQPATPPQVRGAARLLAGSFAGRVTGATRTELIADLLAIEPGEAGLDLVDWFEALGNAATADAVPIVDRYLAVADPRVRALALTAVRRLSGDAVVTLLIERTGRDASSLVRARTIDLLIRHRDDSRVRSFLGEVASSDPDASLRDRARRLL